MISVAHNLAAFNAQRQYNIVTSARAKTAQKLSSGYKINRAADDAAGLAISEKMRYQIRGLDQGAENIQDGISLVQTADGALHEVDDILQRINELSVKSANGTNSDSDRFNINQEIQSLKTELHRVFETTKFNERKIWDNTPISVKTGEITGTHTVTDAAVVFNTFSNTSIINDSNRGAVPNSSVTVRASEEGLVTSWTGYDGIKYRSNTIPWDSTLTGSHSFKLSDHMDYTKYPNAAGIDFTYRYTVDSKSELSDVISAFNTRSDSDVNYSISAPVYTESLYNSNSDPRIVGTGASINYAAQLASDKSFTAADDAFIEFSEMVNPASSSVNDADKFSFTFEMDNIGTVNATVSGAYYYGSYNSSLSDRTGENIWWEEYTRYNGQKAKRTITYPGDGSLNGILDSITNTAGHSLWADNNSGGAYSLSFSLTSANPYTCMNGTKSSAVGTLSMSFSISKGSASSQEGLVNYITNALNNLSGIDIYDKDNSNPSTVRFYRNSNRNSYNSVSETKTTTTELYKHYYPGMQNVYIQCSSNIEDNINIIYENLTLDKIGLKDINTLDEKSSLDSIDRVGEAIKIVNRQRSVFGAYQNRLESSYDNNRNIAENTQAAESLIRDTDMALEMVKFSTQNILASAGEAMLSQANKSNSNILSLLG